jgi:hypothetical protein
MPNYHENSYRVRSEFAAILKGLSGFQISAAESDAYAHIKIVQANRVLRYLSGSYSRLPYYSDRRLIHELLNELAKDQVDAPELIRIGLIFKKYIHLAKDLDVEHRYYTIMPLIITSFFLLLLFALLVSPNRGFVYSGLAAGFYSIGFWVFSIYSFSKSEQALSKLANQLLEKINQLRSSALMLSVTPLSACTVCQSTFISDRLPSYEEAVRDANAVLTPITATPSFTALAPTHSPFFYTVSSNSSDISDSLSSTDTLFPSRTYSI